MAGGGRELTHEPADEGAPALLGLTGEAAASFAPSAVDLLLLGGQAGDAAVLDGFRAWLPKLSDRAVVLVHGASLHPPGGGPTALWDELSAQYPSFAFPEQGGPGMVAVGNETAPALARLCTPRGWAAVAARGTELVAADEQSPGETRSLEHRTGVAPGREPAIGRPPGGGLIPASARSRELRRGATEPGGKSATPVELRISVVIPLYNGARFIAEALDSALAQTLRPAEIIVVDDGSTDDGPAIVARMAETQPITLLRAAHRGQSAARNAGIALSTGSHIALLDQDDIWYPDHLQKLSQPFLLRRHRKLGWVYSNLDEIEEDGSMRVRACLRLGRSPHPKRDLLQCLRHDMFVLPSASLIARAALVEVGPFDENLSGYEDDDLFLRMFRMGYECVYINQPLSQWRVHFSSGSFSPAMMRSRMIYFRKLSDQFPDDPRRSIRYIRDLLGPRFLAATLQDYLVALRCGDETGARVAANGLALVARSNRVWVRVLFRALRPLLRSPPLARSVLPFSLMLRPLLRRALQ